MNGTLWQRVFDKVELPAPGLPFDHTANQTKCWNWKGALSKKRRGQRRPHIKLAPRPSLKTGLVARIVCEWFHGPPPTELHEAGHTCPDGENCKCVSPYHLQWMTRFENEQFKQESRRRHHGTPGQDRGDAEAEVPGGEGPFEGRGDLPSTDDKERQGHPTDLG